MSKGEPMKLLNVKVSQSLRSLVEHAAGISECRNLSEWCREALEASAYREIAAVDRTNALSQAEPAIRGLTPSQGRPLGVRALPTAVGRCVHPTPARRTTASHESCTLCGAITRWRV